MSEKRIKVRNLLRKDLRKVTWMDKESGNSVGDWIEFLDRYEDKSDAYGLFEGERLVAYFTVDEIMEGSEEVEDFPVASEYQWYINNVYVRDSYRGKKYGLRLIEEVVRDIPFPTMLIAKTEELIDYYQKIGYEHLGNQCMRRLPEKNKKIYTIS